MAKLAKKHHAYIVTCVDRKEQDTYYNSAVLIKRDGEIVGVYDKVYPVMPNTLDGNDWNEFGNKNGKPGADVPVFETDFGRIGIAICFDAHFAELWQRLADRDAELVLFPSMFSGGRLLGAYATIHHYYIVTSVWEEECKVFDINGDKIFDKKGGIHRITLDMDRRIVHSYYPGRAQEMRDKYGIALKDFSTEEDWGILEPTRPNTDLPKLMKAHKIFDLRDHMNAQREAANRARGHVFHPSHPDQFTTLPYSDNREG